MENTVDKVLKGERPDTIGITKVEDNQSIRFRCVYPDDSGRDMDEAFDDYQSAKTWFEANKKLIGDIQLFVVLLDEDEDNGALDEEIIDSFLDEDEVA